MALSDERSFNEVRFSSLDDDAEYLPFNPLPNVELNDASLISNSETSSSDSMLFDFDLLSLPLSPSIEASFHNNESSSLRHGDPASNTGVEQSHYTPQSSEKMPKDRNRILTNWLEQHSQYPYPTKPEKAHLASQTELNISQVSTWFANARRRRKMKRSSTASNGLSGTFTLQVQPTQEPFSPLDRWRNSPPEIEAASLEDIMSAVNGSNTSGIDDPAFFSTNVSQKHSQSNNYDATSVICSKASRSDVSNSSGSSASSFESNSSHGSFSRFYLDGQARRRRRRRLKSTSILPKARARTIGDKRPYQCTFCTDKFRTKHDWTRHERTLHLSLETFMCSPHGAKYIDQLDGAERCAFCDCLSPSPQHIESHRFSTCQQKPAAFRTFHRKDHLVQHLRLVHGVKDYSKTIIERWKSQVTFINSRCGFCGERFSGWPERNTHIAQHFKNGALMKDWRGCRGLDPALALAVENAMPPYLIGIESEGIEPFRASRLAVGQNGNNTQATGSFNVPGSKPTPYEYLTARLTEFVNQCRVEGQTITDEALQREARCIVYEDDDSWNQTAADNIEWLKMFKEGLGLSETAFMTPSNQRGDEDYAFCLPWSYDQLASLYPTAEPATSGASNMVNTSLPWSWQSPECLVEFRQHIMNTCAAQCEEEGGANHNNPETFPSWLFDYVEMFPD